MSAAPAKRATSFPLPEKALGMHTILLAKTRAGKSSTLRLIVEHGLDQGIPVCIIDPKGDWWGIKSSADGKRPGYPVVIFGGEHADVPINEHAGAHVAELIATGNRPALIDLGGWMPGPRTRFFLDFAAAFFIKTRGRRWLVVDECHNFAPQGKVLDPDSGKMLHWANRLVNEGGGKGVTVFSASQRPQKVHADYRTAHDTLIALRCIHPLDRDAVKDWISGFDPAQAKEIVASLPELERGEAWCWSPEAKWGPKRLQFPKFSTFDSFAAPTGDEHVTKLKGWAEVDLDDVRAKLAAVVEEAKANDPKALKAEIEKLKRALAAAETKTQAPSPNAQAAEAIRAKAFADGAASRQPDIDAAYRKGFDDAAEQASRAVSTLNAPPPPKPAAPRAPADVQPLARPAPPPPQRQAPPSTPSAVSGDLTAPQVRIIEALAFWEALGFAEPSNAQVAAAGGFSVTSSHYTNRRGELVTLGLARYPRPGHVSLTDAGRAIAPAPDGRSARDRLAAILTDPQARILDALPKDGSALSNEELASAAGFNVTSSHYTNRRGELRTLGAVTYPQPGFVAVEPWVWSA